MCVNRPVACWTLWAAERFIGLSVDSCVHGSQQADECNSIGNLDEDLDDQLIMLIKI